MVYDENNAKEMAYYIFYSYDFVPLFRKRNSQKKVYLYRRNSHKKVYLYRKRGYDLGHADHTDRSGVI